MYAESRTGRVKNGKHVTVVGESTKLICLEKIDDVKDRVNYESESEIKIDVDENKTNLLSSISSLESNKNKKTNLENENYENFEYDVTRTPVAIRICRPKAVSVRAPLSRSRTEARTRLDR